MWPADGGSLQLLSIGRLMWTSSSPSYRRSIYVGFAMALNRSGCCLTRQLLHQAWNVPKLSPRRASTGGTRLAFTFHSVTRTLVVLHCRASGFDNELEKDCSQVWLQPVGSTSFCCPVQLSKFHASGTVLWFPDGCARVILVWSADLNRTAWKAGQKSYLSWLSAIAKNAEHLLTLSLDLYLFVYVLPRTGQRWYASVMSLHSALYSPQVLTFTIFDTINYCSDDCSVRIHWNGAQSALFAQWSMHDPTGSSVDVDVSSCVYDTNTATHLTHDV